jgi:sortase A
VSIDDTMVGLDPLGYESTPESVGSSAGGPASDPVPASPDRTRAASPGDLAKTIGGWVLVTLIGLAVVLYFLSPVFTQRDQHRMMSSYETVVSDSSREAKSFYGLTLPTEPPATGSSVGIIQIGRLHLQDVVSEGVGPAQTERGPGHVPGTAGLGQPGNSAVVARRSTFGAQFAHLSSLRKGDPIVVTTIEGQSVYRVVQERTVSVNDSAAPPSSSGGLTGTSSSGPAAPTTLGSSISFDDLYGPSADNRLTLVTSASDLPWNSSKAVVVVATMSTQPFTPTPQQARSSSENGTSGSGDALALLTLALLFFGAIVVGAVVLYRRGPVRTAYLISTAPLIVAVILLAMAVSRLLPAWT